MKETDKQKDVTVMMPVPPVLLTHFIVLSGLDGVLGVWESSQQLASSAGPTHDKNLTKSVTGARKSLVGLARLWHDA